MDRNLMEQLTFHRRQVTTNQPVLVQTRELVLLFLLAMLKDDAVRACIGFSQRSQ